MPHHVPCIRALLSLKNNVDIITLQASGVGGLPFRKCPLLPDCSDSERKVDGRVSPPVACLRGSNRSIACHDPQR